MVNLLVVWHFQPYINLRVLCNNIIMQSGNIISPLAMNKNPKQAFHTLLMNTRCAITAVLPVHHQVECLKQLTITELNLDDGELLLF